MDGIEGRGVIQRLSRPFFVGWALPTSFPERTLSRAHPRLVGYAFPESLSYARSRVLSNPG